MRNTIIIIIYTDFARQNERGENRPYDILSSRRYNKIDSPRTPNTGQRSPHTFARLTALVFYAIGPFYPKNRLRSRSTNKQIKHTHTHTNITDEWAIARYFECNAITTIWQRYPRDKETLSARFFFYFKDYIYLAFYIILFFITIII